MEVFDGRLYLGSGNSNNAGPATNAGPVEVWYYDDQNGAFAYDYVVNEEQIDEFVIAGGTLYIPGHDSRGDGKHGNIYFLRGERWVKRDNVPGALHVYDLHLYHGNLFAALGLADTSSRAVAVSSDNGRTWTLGELPTGIGGTGRIGVGRAWKFFEVNDTLYVSVLAFPKMQPVPSLNGNLAYRLKGYNSFVYRLTGIDANGVAHFEASDVDFFDGLYPPNFTGKPLPRIARPVQFDAHVVYLGVVTVIDHNWQPFGLFSVDFADNVQQYDLADGALPRDLFVQDNVLYLLVAAPVAQGGYEMRVRATCDLQNWVELFRFRAATFSRSFARYNDNFYFGQGTEAAPISDEAGNILEVPGTFAQYSCPASN